jgi:hypothetical protein
LQVETTQLSWIKVYHKVWSTKVHKGVTMGTKDHTVPQSYTKPYPTIPFPNYTLYSREDQRPLVTASSAIMIVVLFANVSALYPRVVISSLNGWLEKPPFCHSLHFLSCMAQRSLHAITKVYYMSMPYFATDSPSKAPLAVLSIPLQRPLLHRVVQAFHKVCHMYDMKKNADPHSTEQDTQPIAFLISKQVSHTRHMVAHVVLGGLLLRFGS